MWETSGEIFNWVLRGSLYSVAVVLIIVLTQKLTRRVLSAQWSYALWLILLARLVLPAGLETNWSLWNLASPERWAHWTASDFSEKYTAMPVGITLPITLPDATAYSEQGQSAQSIGNNGSIHPQNRDGFFPGGIKQILPVVWLGGVLVMAIGAAFINLRLWNSVRGLSPTTDSKLLELFEDCKRQMRVKTMTGLVVTDRVENPFLFGFIRPRVLLPAGLVQQASSDQLRCVLLHELAHLKRGDIITGWLIAILQSLHWFNPVIWWAFYRMRFDREAACDALVLSRMPDVTRGHYGDALIGMMERFNYPRHQPAIVAGIFESKEQLKRRLIMIKKFKTLMRRETIAAAALMAVLSIALLTDPRSLLSQPGDLNTDGFEAQAAVAAALNALGGADKINGIQSLVIKGKMTRAVFSSSTASKYPGVMMKTDSFTCDTEIRILLPDNIIQIDIHPAGNRGLFNLFSPSTTSTTNYEGLSQGKSLAPQTPMAFINGVAQYPDADTLARQQANAVNNQIIFWSRFLGGMLVKSGPVPLTISSGSAPGVFTLAKDDGELGDFEFDPVTGYPSVIRYKTQGAPSFNMIPSEDTATGRTLWSGSAGPGNMVDAEIRFRDRFSVDGIMFPRVIHWLTPGMSDRELWIQEVQINPGLSLTDFQPPEVQIDPNHSPENIQFPKPR